MKITLFPEMDADIRESKIAERREKKQRAREYLTLNLGTQDFILHTLSRKGPTLDVVMFQSIMELSDSAATLQRALSVFLICEAMWFLGIIAREEVKDHPCGETVYRYSIKPSKYDYLYAKKPTPSSDREQKG